MKPEETIDYHIKWAWHAIQRMYNEEAKKYGFSMSIGYVLLNIDIKNGTPSTQLGPKMGIESTSLSRTLKKMEKKNLITRKTNPVDGRSVLIYLTPNGKKKRVISKEKVLRFNKKLQSILNKRKINTFIEVIKKTKEVIKEKKIY